MLHLHLSVYLTQLWPSVHELGYGGTYVLGPVLGAIIGFNLYGLLFAQPENVIAGAAVTRGGTTAVPATTSGAAVPATTATRAAKPSRAKTTKSPRKITKTQAAKKLASKPKTTRKRS